MSKNSDRFIPLFLAIAFWLLSLWFLVCGAYAANLLKDGMGPDSVESHGVLAWYRFWVGFRGIFGFWVVPTFVLGTLSYWCDRRSHRAIVEETNPVAPS